MPALRINQHNKSQIIQKDLLKEKTNITYRWLWLLKVIETRFCGGSCQQSSLWYSATVEVYECARWLRDPRIQHFSGSPALPPHTLSPASQPSELTLTINNHVGFSAYILSLVQKHSWDVWSWAVRGSICRFVARKTSTRSQNLWLVNLTVSPQCLRGEAVSAALGTRRSSPNLASKPTSRPDSAALPLR